MATKPLVSNPVADLPENWTNGQTVAPSGSSVGLSTQHGYNYLMGKVNEALEDIGTINDAFSTTVPSPATTTPSAVGTSGSAGASTLYARADHVHAQSPAGTANPLMDGTASAGTATTWSRSDHVHPTDTSRQAKITASGILSGNGSGTISANGTVTIAQGGTGATSAANALTNLGAAAASHNHAASNITSGTLGVARGGTGASSFTANSAIVSGSSTTAALTTRAITDNTAATSAITGSTNLVTMNTLKNALNRATAVASQDTNYTTYMARGTALFSTDTVPTYNGQIAWTYY